MDPPEDVCTTLRTPAQRAASASLMVPTTFTDASNWGSATECRTSIWAARWNTTSGRCSSRMACRSAVTMSASTKTNPGLSARCSRLVARPDAKLSRPTTEPPSAIKRSTSVDPMNPAAPVTSARTGPPYRRASGVAVAAAALIALQLVIRGVLAFRGYFYWDDLILIGRAGTHNLLSAPYLFDDHDGHLMPAAYLVAGAIARLAALAWVCGDAVLLVRTGNQRYAVTGLLVYLGGLLFFEKAAVIPFVAFAVTALLSHVRGESAIGTVWRRGVRLWTASLALTAAWIAVYLVVVDQQRWSTDVAMTWDLLRRSVTHGIVPGLAGGPWAWDRWAPASPWATPPPVIRLLGWAVLALALAVTLLRKQRIMPVWLTAVGYAVACQVPIYLMRSSRFTALELAQALRYFPDLVIVLGLVAAVGFCAPNRPLSRWLDASTPRTAVTTVLAALFMASSLYSTATFLASWRDNPAQPYLQNAQRDLTHAASNPPLLDQEVDPLVLGRVTWPENLASHMFALMRHRPEFAPATTQLRMLDSSGRLVDARVAWIRTIEPGPAPRCGYFVQPDMPASLALDGPLLPSDWTAEINYLANSDGSMTMSLSEGSHVKVPVHPGLNRVYVRLPGAGNAITVRADTAALSVCIASGPVGYVVRQ